MKNCISKTCLLFLFILIFSCTNKHKFEGEAMKRVRILRTVSPSTPDSQSNVFGLSVLCTRTLSFMY